MHIGIRGPVSDRQDLIDDANMGFSIVGTWETEDIGVAGLIEKIREQVDGYALYLSIDIDVLDPAFALGTGMPEIRGLRPVSLPASCVVSPTFPLSDST
jgi:agmatinase